MSRTPKSPRAPYDHFVDGGVWHVRVEHRRSVGLFGEPLYESREYLLLVRRGVKGRGLRWARTKLALGDLQLRSVDKIFADFSELMRQDPPVPGNYLLVLERDNDDEIQWLFYKGVCHAPT
jgi:hypothetical protein